MRLGTDFTWFAVQRIVSAQDCDNLNDCKDFVGIQNFDMIVLSIHPYPCRAVCLSRLDCEITVE